MKLGFTGTRVGMTESQKETFKKFLQDINPTVFHHGCCVGADTEAAWIVDDQDWNGKRVEIVGHPGRSAKEAPKPSEEVDLGDGPRDDTREPKTHFARNRDIVDETDILVCCPKDAGWQPKGGTWYTHDYALKKGKKVYVIWPSGNLYESSGVRAEE